MFHELWTLLQEVISYVFVIKKVHINMCPLLDGYGVMVIFNSRTRPRVNRVLRNQLAGNVLNLVAYRFRKLQRATRAVHNRAAAGGIFETQL